MLPNYYNVSSQKNNRIKFTHYDKNEKYLDNNAMNVDT